MAFLDENGLTRLWNKIENVIGSAINQLRGNVESTYTKPYVNNDSATFGKLILYISKQGSDDNDGLTQQTPLLTIEKAFEIGNRNIISSSYGILILCIGPGEWGSITIGQKPYIVELHSFDIETVYTSYTDIPNFPHFTEISCRSYIYCYNINADIFKAYDNQYISLYDCACGRCYSVNESTIFIQDYIFIKNTNQNYVFCTQRSASIVFNPSGDVTAKVVVCDSLTLSSSYGFFYAASQGRIHGMVNVEFILNDGVTVTGRKYRINAGASFAYIGTNVDNIPGTGVFCEAGAIIDGITQGDTIHPGNKTFTDSITINGDHGAIENTAIILSGARQNYGLALQATNATKGTAPSATINSGIEFYGSVHTKYQNRYALLENTISTANLNTLKLVAYNPTSEENTGNCTISVNVDGSGNAYTYAPTPAVADSSTKIATTAWARTATGNFACNAATATKATQDSAGNNINSTYVKCDGTGSDILYHWFRTGGNAGRLLVCRGRAQTTKNALKTITFPKAFASGVVPCVVTTVVPSNDPSIQTASSVYTFVVSSRTNTNFKVLCQVNDSATNPAYYFNWVAVGLGPNS